LEYVATHYKAETFNVPFFLDTCKDKDGKALGKLPLQRIGQRDPFNDQNEQEEAVVTLATRKCVDVPVLVIARDGETVERLARQIRKQLHKKGMDDDDAVLPMLHNPRKPQEFLDLVERSTEPLMAKAKGSKKKSTGSDVDVVEQKRWRIAVTTAEGGRGHDYRVVDPDVDGKGGLLVILTFVPWSEREWIQFLGRTGRQDRNGQHAVLLNARDQQVQLEQPLQQPGETLVEAMLRHGDMETANEFGKAEEELQKVKVMHTLSARFWTLHMTEGSTLPQNWAWKKLCQQYMSRPEDFIRKSFDDVFPPDVMGQDMKVSSRPHASGKRQSSLPGPTLLQQAPRGMLAHKHQKNPSPVRSIEQL